MVESFSSLFHGRIFPQLDNNDIGDAEGSFEANCDSDNISNASLFVNSPCLMSITHDKPLPRRTSKTIKRRLINFYDDASPRATGVDDVTPLSSLGLLGAEDMEAVGLRVVGGGDESSRDSGVSVCSSSIDAAPPPRQELSSLMDMEVEVEGTWLTDEDALVKENSDDGVTSGDFMRWLRCSTRLFRSHLSPLLDDDSSPCTLPLRLPLTRSSFLTVHAVDRRCRLSTCSTLSDTSSNGGSPTPMDSPTLSWLTTNGSKSSRLSVLGKENLPRLTDSKVDQITGATAFKPKHIVSERTDSGRGVCWSLGEEEEDKTRSSAGVKDFQRCHREAFIKHVLCEKDEEERGLGGKGDLVGDKSTHHSLHLVQSHKHSDLKCISPDTMAAVLRNEYDDVIDRYTIIDCRYPYEYAGGHIEGAKNICTKEELICEYFTWTKHQSTAASSSTQLRRNILIFHCEFSSERAPKLLRFLRNHDRHVHKDSYPSLHYPEIYLLEGGYKAFYETHTRLCSPMSYMPMLHSDHAADLRHFRCKSKSSGESRTGSRSHFIRRKSFRM